MAYWTARCIGSPTTALRHTASASSSVAVDIPNGHFVKIDNLTIYQATGGTVRFYKCKYPAASHEYTGYIALNFLDRLTAHDQPSTFTVSGTQYFGDALTFSVTADDAAFTHTATIRCGDANVSPFLSHEQTLSGLGGNGTAFTFTFTPPRSWMDVIPNALETNLTVTLETFSNGVSEGTTSKTLLMGVPADAAPVVGTPTVEVDAATSLNGVILQGVTLFRAGVTVASAGGASLERATILRAGVVTEMTWTGASSGGRRLSGTYTSVNAVSPVAGSVPMQIIVYDSRGRSTSVTVTATVAAYSPPVISNVRVERCDAQGVSAPLGTYAAVSALILYSNLGTGTNGCAAAYRANENDAWTALSGAVAANGVAVVLGGSFLTTQAYQFRLTATDKTGRTSIWYDELSPGPMLLHLRDDQRGLGVGRMCDEQDAVMIADGWTLNADAGAFAGDVAVGGDVDVTGGLTVGGKTVVGGAEVGKTLWEGSLGISGTATLDAAFSGYRLYGIVFSGGILCVCSFDSTVTSTALVSFNQVTTRHITLLITLELTSAGVLSMQSASSLRHEYSGSHGSVNNTTTQTITAVYGLA